MCRESTRSKRKTACGGESIDMKLKELLSGVRVIHMTADPEMEITGISYDSRKTATGDLFIAIRGFETDGHRYIPKDG